MRSKRSVAIIALVPVLAAFVLGTSAAPALASQSVFDFFGSTGSGAGQFAEGLVIKFGAEEKGHEAGAAGVAVDDSTGDVYVADRSNNRVEQFDSEDNFIRAWGVDVISGGATGTGNVTKDSFEVSAVLTTSRAFIPGQEISGDGIPAGTTIVRVTSAAGANSKLTLSQKATETKTGVALTAAEGAGSVPQDEQQTISLSATSGNFKLAFKTTVPTLEATTGNLAFDASAEAIEEALEKLPNIGAGNIAVSGPDGGPYAIEFKGTRFADTNVPQLIAAEGSPPLAGPGKALIQTTTEGAGRFEKCTEATSCQAGTSSGIAGGLGLPNGVAVDQSSGNVYVSDQENIRVDEFDSSGTFIRAFGGNVVESGPDDKKPGEAEICESGVDVCRMGERGTLGGVFGAGTFTESRSEGYLAIAPGGPYAGDLFAADTYNHRIQIFNPSGAFIGAFGRNILISGPETAEKNVCLAALGDVCTTGTIGKLSPNNYGFYVDGFPKRYFPPNRFAIGPSGAVYVPNFDRLQRYSPDLTTEHDVATALCSKSVEQEFCRDVAVDPNTGDVYVAFGIVGREEKEIPGFGTVTIVTLKEMGVARYDAALDEPPLETDLEGAEVGPIGGMAIDGSSGKERSGRIYFSTQGPEQRVDVLGEPTPPTVEFAKINPEKLTPHSATLSASINPNGNKIHTLYRFETLVQGGVWNQYPVPNADIGNGTAPQMVETTIPNLLANTEYRVRLTAFKGQRHTTPEQAFTTPQAGPEIETGAAQWSGPPESSPSLTFSGHIHDNNLATHYFFEYGTDGSYGKRVPFFETGAHPASTEAFTARQTVDGLDPATAYHYRLVARSASGTTVGEDREVGQAEAGRRYPELVSPAEKGVGRVGTAIPGVGQVSWQAADGGDKMAYDILSGSPDGTAGGDVMNLGSRDSLLGWQSAQLTPPSLVPAGETYTQGASAGFVRWQSPELDCGFTQSHGPLTPNVSEFEIEHGTVNLFRHDYATDAYVDITTQHLNTPPEFNRGYRIAAASSDCNRVVFETLNRLLPGLPAPENEHLYEWESGGGPNGTLRSADVLPDESIPSGGAMFGSVSGNLGMDMNAVSRPDASRVFFGVGSALFVRENHASTAEYSKSQTATPNNSESRYWMASSDGSHAFFTARYGIAANGTSGGASSCISESGQGCDLYDYDVESGILTDLTPDSNPADTEGASVSGVLGAADDGSYVYFAAKGQLISGEGRTFNQNKAGAGFNNIYLAHEGALSFVGSISAVSGEDEGVFVNNPSSLSSRVTPDGHYLLFTSNLQLTGYNSEGVKELYRYSAPEESLQCISCRSDELPPHGKGSRMIPVTPLAIDNYNARMMSSDGSRVFFNSEDKLTADAIDGSTLQKSAYEWHNGIVHLLAAPGEFVDSSADGRDAFVLTPAALAPQDLDFAPDLYDLRIDGGFPYFPTEPCDPLAENSCQGTPPPPPPPTPDPASSSSSGPGNPPVPSARKHKPRKQHRKHRSHKHKSHKRAAQHKRGGAR